VRFVRRADLSCMKLPASSRRATCRGCGETIYFVRTEKEKWAPFNPDGTSHFGTCSHASYCKTPPERPEHEHAEEFEERVGILYYEAGLPLPEAERQAEAIIRSKYPSYTQGSLF